jgi:hypothetical protein
MSANQKWANLTWRGKAALGFLVLSIADYHTPLPPVVRTRA